MSAIEVTTDARVERPIFSLSNLIIVLVMLVLWALTNLTTIQPVLEQCYQTLLL